MAGHTPTIITPFTKTVAATGTPEALGADTVEFTTITFVGKKAARTSNTSTVYVQFVSSNDAPGIPITSGDVKTVNAPTGKVFNASQFYIDVETNGDGVLAFPMR